MKIIAEGAVGTRYRRTSYDATVGTMVSRREQNVVTSDEFVVLPPQGVVEVISAEKLEVPENITGFASVKTSLCDEGVMALNIGLIDPGYKGHLSSTLVNFGKDEYVIGAGEPFLRLTFLRCDVEEDPEIKKTTKDISDSKEYIKEKSQKIVRFSETFLNLRAAIADEARPVFWRYAAIGGALIALFAFSVNLGLVTVARTYWSRAEVRQDVLQDVKQSQYQDLQRQLIAMKADRDALYEEQKKLKSDLDQLRSQLPVTKRKRTP